MNAPVPAAPSLAARLWPWGLAAVLMLTVAGNLAMLRVAGADRTFSIEPDYYARAVRWEDHQAQLSANAALGWQLTAMTNGGNMLLVAARDKGGAPLSGLAMQAEATANRAGDRVERLTLRETAAGRYAAATPLSAGGQWRLTLTAQRGADRFVETLPFDAGPARR